MLVEVVKTRKMPYWSSSRVGAVPFSGNGNQKNASSSKSNKRSARRGITMEDLKKQTALRLAQERGTAPDDDNTPIIPPQVIDGVSTPQKSRFLLSPFSRNVQVSQLPVNATPVVSNPNVFSTSGQPTTPTSNYVVPHPPSNLDNEIRMNRNMNQSNMYVVSHSMDSATEKGANSKLPHGLTVYELKEMTKARLEAEAMNQHRVVSLEGNIPLSNVDSFTNDSYGVTPSAPSPIPTIGYNSRSSTRSPYISGVDTSFEPWENTSVSTSASDFQTTDALYSSGLHGSNAILHTVDDVIPFSRSTSYPNHPNAGGTGWGKTTSSLSSHDGQYHQQHIVQQGSYFDSHLPNRRRATTLSPRVGTSFVSHGGPADIRSGSGSSHGRNILFHDDKGYNDVENITRPISSYPLQHRHSDNCGIIGGTDLLSTIGILDSNRIRTASLPTILCPTSEDYATQFQSTFGSVDENAILHASTNHDVDPPVVAGLSDVFRTSTPSCFDDTVTFPGFVGSSASLVNHTSTSFGYDPPPHGRTRAVTSDNDVYNVFTSSSVAHDDPQQQRIRAATWAESASSHLLFCGATTDLSDDLASILKLSTSSSTSGPNDSSKIHD